MSSQNDSKLFYLATGKNIKKYRELRNYSLQVLAEKVGLTKKTIHRYENGEIRIDMDRLADIAKALDVNVQQLTEGASSFIGVDVTELNTVNLPVVESVSCENGLLAFEHIEGYETTPRSWIDGGEYFYLRAKGDSMTGARIFDGDLLLIRKQDDIEDGDIAAVLVEGEAVLKRVYRQGSTLILNSENTAYHPIVCDLDKNPEIKIIGKLKKIVINFS
jgi:repressor LexA